MNEKFFALPSEKQNRIINAGLEHFTRWGYQQASTGKIAETANISKSLLFHYFTNKRDFYMYLYNYSLNFQKSAIQETNIYSCSDLLELLHTGLKIKCQLMRQYPYLNLFLIQAYYEEDPEVRISVGEFNNEVLSESIDIFIKMIDTSKLRPEVDLHTLLELFIYYADGYLRSLIHQKEISPDKIEQDCSRIIQFLKPCCYKEEYL